jgi:two-component system response regulator DctR
MTAGLVYTVDDDKALRRALAGLLSDANFEIIECESAEAFLQTKTRYESSCVLLDVKMGGISGFDLQAQLSKREFSPPIIFLTGSASLPQAVNAMRSGASHFLTKPVNDQILIDTISEAIEQSNDNALFFSFLQKLTSTEQTIAKLVRQGLLTKQIATQLSLSLRTVEWHRKNIRAKGGLPQ